MGFATSKKATIEYIDMSDATAVVSTGNNVQILTPPVGYIYEIISIRAVIPAIGGAAGTHYLDFFHANCGVTGESIISVNGANGATFYLTPSTALSALPALKCSHTQPLHARYFNNSDTTQSGTRTVHVMVKKIPAGV